MKELINKSRIADLGDLYRRDLRSIEICVESAVDSDMVELVQLAINGEIVATACSLRYTSLQHTSLAFLACRSIKSAVLLFNQMAKELND